MSKNIAKQCGKVSTEAKTEELITALLERSIAATEPLKKATEKELLDAVANFEKLLLKK